MDIYPFIIVNFLGHFSYSFKNHRRNFVRWEIGFIVSLLSQGYVPPNEILEIVNELDTHHKLF
jgi:hypothetical protein